MRRQSNEPYSPDRDSPERGPLSKDRTKPGPRTRRQCEDQYSSDRDSPERDCTLKKRTKQGPETHLVVMVTRLDPIGTSLFKKGYSSDKRTKLGLGTNRHCGYQNSPDSASPGRNYTLKNWTQQGPGTYRHDGYHVGHKLDRYYTSKQRTTELGPRICGRGYYQCSPDREE